MSCKGYIIEKYNNMVGAYTCNRLLEEARSLGMDVRLVGIHDTVCAGSQVMNAGEVLAPRQFVINRYKHGNLKDMLNTLAPRTYNDLGRFGIYINKFEQVQRIRSDAFRMPRCLLATGLVPYATVAARLGSPFVAKGLESSMGQEVFFIEQEADLRALSERFGIAKEWLFEEYIASSYGRDLRVFSVRGRAVAAMIRSSQADFRANVALGAKVEGTPVTPVISAIADDIYQQTHLDFLGIDLLFGADGYYFCEINVMPGMEGIESASGTNIARIVMETIIKDCEE